MGHDLMDPLAMSPEQVERSLEAIAPFYELDFGAVNADLDLYRQLASGFGRARILELGAGLGRVAIPLAEDGHDVTALDASTVMLNHGSAPMRDAGVSVVQADMRAAPATLGSFDLVICALGTFQHLLRRADQVATLCSAAQRLAPGGQLVLDITALRSDDLEAGAQPLRLEWVREDGRLGTVTKLSSQELAEPREAAHPPDGVAPIAWVTYIYECALEHAVRRSVARFPLRVAISPGELEGLLHEARLRPRDWYGSWELDRLGHGDRTIVLSSADAA